MSILSEHYHLTDDQISSYQKHRYIKLKNVFDARTLDRFNQVISHKVHELNQENRVIEDRDTYGRAFLQLFNLWRTDQQIKELVFCKRLAGIAAELLKVEGVRMYHDQALFKEAGGGITPWHADQYYWPLTTDKTITAWIPLQATPLEMGPLEFSAGSHKIIEGRELEISDNSEEVLDKKLRISDFNHVIKPFDMGEVSFHSGWIFHRAGANTTPQVRKVMTAIYMDQDITLKAPENKHQQADWETWCPGAAIGEKIDTVLNPVIG